MPHWIVFNKRSGAPLAQAFWYPQWKCYVVEFKPQCVFNKECLNDIKTFLEVLKAEPEPADIALAERKT
jgi:hypothetical protein